VFKPSEKRTEIAFRVSDGVRYVVFICAQVLVCVSVCRASVDSGNELSNRLFIDTYAQLFREEVLRAQVFGVCFSFRLKVVAAADV